MVSDQNEEGHETQWAKQITYAMVLLTCLLGTRPAFGADRCSFFLGPTKEDKDTRCNNAHNNHLDHNYARPLGPLGLSALVQPGLASIGFISIVIDSGDRCCRPYVVAVLLTVLSIIYSSLSIAHRCLLCRS